MVDDAKSTDTSADEADAKDDEVSDEQIWNELSDDKGASQDDDDESSPDGDDFDDEADEAGDDSGSDANDKPDAQTKTAAVSDNDADKSKASSTKQTKASDPDPQTFLSDASPEVKAYVEKLQNDLQSANGRVRTLTKKASTPARSAQTAEARKKADDAKQALDRVREEYPDVVGPLADVLETVTAKVDAFEQADAEERMEIVKEETQLFETKHPGGLDFVEKNAEAFSKWVDDQPKAIRDTVAANIDAIVDGAAAASVLDQFKAFLEPAEDPANQETEKRLTDKKRERQLNGARTSTSSRSPRVTEVPPDADDDQAHWDYWDRQEARKRQRSRV